MYYKNKQTKSFMLLLDSGAEVSLIHAGVYNSLKEKPKLKITKCISPISKRWTAIDVDSCASLKYEIGRDKSKNMNSL